MKLAAVLLAVSAAALVAAAPAAPRKRAPAAVDWTRTVSVQPSGGYRMGNPKAPVRLVEYVSLTCPHCRTFDEEAASPLMRNYVRTGRVSYEVRNFVRDPVDLSAALISRCNGAKSFFRLSRDLLKDQSVWFGKAQSLPSERLEAIQQLPRNRQMLEMAQAAGLQRWAAARGIPFAKSRQCLTNGKEIERLIQMTRGAVEDHADFPGTPSFMLNGQFLGDTATWDQLEPKLREALGERDERG